MQWLVGCKLPYDFDEHSQRKPGNNLSVTGDAPTSSNSAQDNAYCMRITEIILISHEVLILAEVWQTIALVMTFSSKTTAHEIGLYWRCTIHVRV